MRHCGAVGARARLPQSGGPPTRQTSHRAGDPLVLWERRPAAKLPPAKPIRREGAPPTGRPSACWERRLAAKLPRRGQFGARARLPQGGPPTRRTSHRAGGPLFLWERRPAAKLPPAKPIRREGAPPTRRTSHKADLPQGGPPTGRATHCFCGSGASPRSCLRPSQFGARAHLPRVGVLRLCLWCGASPRCGIAGPSARGRASHKAADLPQGRPPTGRAIHWFCGSGAPPRSCLRPSQFGARAHLPRVGVLRLCLWCGASPRCGIAGPSARGRASR